MNTIQILKFEDIEENTKGLNLPPRKETMREQISTSNKFERNPLQFSPWARPHLIYLSTIRELIQDLSSHVAQLDDQVNSHLRSASLYKADYPQLENDVHVSSLFQQHKLFFHIKTATPLQSIIPYASGLKPTQIKLPPLFAATLSSFYHFESREL